jgi:hypothetical protein
VRQAARALLWLHGQRKTVNRWVVRVVSFYFGYQILHHEVYEAEHVEPLIFFFGLWLIGIAPASFVEGLKKVGQQAKGSLEEMAGEVPGADEDAAPPTRELRLVDKPQGEGNGA